MENKTVLITGASRGIGAATARLLFDNGANLILAARSLNEITALAQALDSSGNKVIAVACDVSNYADVSNAVDTAIKRFGKLDVLINNAGLIEPIKSIHESDPTQWGHVIDVNTKGVYYGTHAVLQHMLPNKQGTIINISSGAASGALEGWSHYCASKAAALSITRCTDKEYRDQGINVIGMSPGTVATDMQVAIKQSGINPVSKMSAGDHIPPDWAAKAIMWLCSEEALDFRGQDFLLRDEDNRRKVGLA
ncbi:MAG: SDR family oxidoreductase [Granulosicoccaceae bacterium]